jgi:hypothetical protein
VSRADPKAQCEVIQGVIQLDPPVATESDPSDTAGNEAVASMPVGVDDQAAQSRLRPGHPRSKPNLHPEVERYLDRLSENAPRRITIEDFCLVSGFGDDTIFGFWRRGQSRCTEAHANRFQKTLTMSPQQFLAELAKKRP